MQKLLDMKADNDWKKRLGVVYSTNPDFDYSAEPADVAVTLPPGRQRLIVRMENKGRAGKTATVVSGFAGSDGDLSELGRTLRQKCGTGGSVKDGEIIVQGDFRDRLVGLLHSLGYTQAKRGN